MGAFVYPIRNNLISKSFPYQFDVLLGVMIAAKRVTPMVAVATVPDV